MNEKTWEERERLIAEQRASGKPARAWCGEKGIPYSTFTSWQRRLRHSGADTPEPAGQREDPGQAGFEPKQPVLWAAFKAGDEKPEPEFQPEAKAPARPENPRKQGRIVIRHRDWEVDIERGFDANLLAEVLKVVNRVCC